MVIIDPPKSPNGPPIPFRAPLAPPPYVPLSSPGSHLNFPPPPRSPGVRPPPSPFSAPASNYLIIKREKADITGSWNINTSLQPVPFVSSRSLSAGSDRESDHSSETGTNTGTDFSDFATQHSGASSAGTSTSLGGSAARPNLKLFTPRGKIDAAIRVSGAHRAWLEAISRDEDVSITFPTNSNATPRAPIRLLARSSAGNVQVHLPNAFKGTLRVPSDTVLPPSLKSRCVVLSPSEPPIPRPPISDESPVKTKLGLGKHTLSTPPTVTVEEEELVIVRPTGPNSPHATNTSPAPQDEGTRAGESTQTGSGASTPEETPVIEESTILSAPEVETPAQEIQPQLSPTLTPGAPAQGSRTPGGSTSLPVPLCPPIVVISPTQTQARHRSASISASSVQRPSSSLSAHHGRAASTSSSHLGLDSKLTVSNLGSHNRSSSNLTSQPNRSTSNLSIQTTLQPAPASHSAAESSTLYFIGDLLHSSYDNNAPNQWNGDEFVVDSEFGRVRVCMYGEKAEVGWAEDVAGKVKDAIDWGKWKNLKSVGGMPLSMPKISVGSMGRRFKFGK